ncbi:MAG TPA: DUF5668 domain-containing protein [Terriglobales bacterium]|nr:DUF5668 domain-containing protein [Terriglobales bacterium]
MNCANHADAPAVAYCRTCGKALCANCTRPVRGVIYCEDCLGAKMEGVPTGAAGFVPGTFSPASGPMPPPQPGSSGPNPAVAGILAGFFPFGVGAVYTGQYAKGLAHLAIFALLIAGINAADSHGAEALETISIFGLVFFIVYQIIDAVRSARAIQAGLPPPDPYGLAATFSGGARIETSKIPMGAIVLILLGVLFLLHTLGLTEFGLDRFWPLILIFVGGWMFARNWFMLGSHGSNCQCSRCRMRRSMGPAMAFTCCQCARCRIRRISGPTIVFTIGVLFLLSNLHESGLGFHRTWPVILLVVGALKLLQGSASVEGHIPFTGFGSKTPNAGGPIPPAPPVPPAPPIPPAPPTKEVNRG